MRYHFSTRALRAQYQYTCTNRCRTHLWMLTYRAHVLHTFIHSVCPYSETHLGYYSCQFPMWDWLWDGPCWVSSFRLPFSSLLSEDLCSFLLPGCVLQFCFLTIIAVPPVARNVFCPLQYSPACRSKPAWIGGSPLLTFHRSRFVWNRRCICSPSAR